MELIEVQMQLASVDSRYVCWLEWIDENGFIKAYPKRRLSMQAQTNISKTFKRLGGRFAYHKGRAYFELAKEPRACSNKIAEACRKLVEDGLFKELEMDCPKCGLSMRKTTANGKTWFRCLSPYCGFIITDKELESEKLVTEGIFGT